MKQIFINRTRELVELENLTKKKGLIVIFGRRRVGKTALILEWLKNKKKGMYSQAIESSPMIQLDQVFKDINSSLQSRISPTSWDDLLVLLGQEKNHIVCIDEFPYLVASDPSLPSRLQKWLDHEQTCTLLLSGSSTHMMHQTFLNSTSPLYGRAAKIIHVKPLQFAHFLDYFDCSAHKTDLFLKYALAGGIPKYWELIDIKKPAIQNAETLYFKEGAFLEMEPHRILNDEGVFGLMPIHMLEAIGRGASKPSEIAAKMNTRQTNLSRIFQQLMDTSLLSRELPFLESTRTTKRTLYKLDDPVLKFWFHVYSPHRTRWRSYPIDKKKMLLNLHASTVFEDFYRKKYPDGSRYWEKDLEFDLVRFAPHSESNVVVTEIKWKNLSKAERLKIEGQLNEKWKRSLLSKKFSKVSFEIIDWNVL